MTVVQGVDKVGSLEEARRAYHIKLHKSYTRLDVVQDLGSRISDQKKPLVQSYKGIGSLTKICLLDQMRQ